MAWIGLAGVVGWLEQPRVSLAHRPRSRQRTEVSRPLLAPALADPVRHPTEEHRTHQHRRHRRHEQRTAWPDAETTPPTRHHRFARRRCIGRRSPEGRDNSTRFCHKSEPKAPLLTWSSMRGSMRPRLTAGDEWSHHRPPSEVRKAIGDHSAPCNPVSNQPCHERAVGPRRGRTRSFFRRRPQGSDRRLPG